MSLRAIPLTIIALVFYNIVVLLGGGAAPDAIMAKHLFSIPLIGRKVPITWGDITIAVTLIVLFVEIVKATYTSTSSLIDHGLSMLVFVACGVQFLLFPSASTGVFFNIVLASLIDVVAGYTIGIRVAKRDIGFGGGDH